MTGIFGNFYGAWILGLKTLGLRTIGLMEKGLNGPFLGTTFHLFSQMSGQKAL